MKRIFYVLIVALLTVACEDEDKFSTGAGMRLDFEVDTLKLDTVFSNTPSSTYKFWVYNRQDNGLRLQTVRLKKGNQTGFRVNVDGIYLDNSNGSQISNVEIRRKDSLLVFVELTAQSTHQLDPKLVEDDLLFVRERRGRTDAEKYDTLFPRCRRHGDLRLAEDGGLCAEGRSTRPDV